MSSNGSLKTAIAIVSGERQERRLEPERSLPLVCVHLGLTPCVWGVAKICACLGFGNIVAALWAPNQPKFAGVSLSAITAQPYFEQQQQQSPGATRSPPPSATFHAPRVRTMPPGSRKENASAVPQTHGVQPRCTQTSGGEFSGFPTGFILSSI